MMNRYAVSLMILLFAGITAHAQWTNNQYASEVVGQLNFATNASGATWSAMYYPDDVVIDVVHSKAYVADYNNQRVMRFAYPFTGTPPTAEMQFGVTGVGGTALDNGVGNPSSLAVYDDVLYVVDNWNSRILRFNNASTKTNQPNPDGILGQTTYHSGASGTTSSKFYYAQGIDIDASGNLWVADASNNRVLKFSNVNSKPTNGTATADLVLGQSDFVSRVSGCTSSALNGPLGVCVQGATVWVADKKNNRMLRFDNPTTSGSAANGVLGQPDFTTGTSGTSQAKFSYVEGIGVDGVGNLYVADGSANRVMIFLNAASKENGAGADNLLGQSSWSGASAQGGQQGFSAPKGIAVDDARGMIFVADFANNRVLGFTSEGALPVQLSSFTGRIALSGTDVVLEWATASEVNNYGYTVQRRPEQDGAFADLANGFVPGNGTTVKAQQYSYTDNSVPATGRYEYRLKQQDLDGAVQFTQSIVVNVSVTSVAENAPREFQLMQNYPNPFNPSTQISFTVAATGHASLTVFNILGEQISVLFNGNATAGEQQSVTFNADNYAGGVYFYRLESAGAVAVKRMQLIR